LTNVDVIILGGLQTKWSRGWNKDVSYCTVIFASRRNRT